MYERKEVASWLSRRVLNEREKLSLVVPSLNGLYSLIFIEEGSITVATDVAGSVPLYYVQTGRAFLITDSLSEIDGFLGDRIPDYTSVIDMLATGTVMGERTLLKNVFTFPQASITTLVFSSPSKERQGRAEPTLPQISPKPYWTFRYDWSSGQSTETLSEKMANMLLRIGKEYSSAISERGWRYGLLLSGGLDSRALAAVFSRNPSLKGKAYSYGAKNDPDVVGGAAIASSLSLPFEILQPLHSTELSYELFKKWTESIGITSRINAGFGSRTAFFREVDIDILITGVTNSGITGQSVSAKRLALSSREEAVHLLYLDHYHGVDLRRVVDVLKPPESPDLEHITMMVDSFDYMDGEEPLFGAVQRWTEDVNENETLGVRV